MCVCVFMFMYVEGGNYRVCRLFMLIWKVYGNSSPAPEILGFDGNYVNLIKASSS